MLENLTDSSGSSVLGMKREIKIIIEDLNYKIGVFL